MYGAELYRRLARRDRRRPVVARGRLAAARLDAGAVRGAPAPGGLGEDVRPAARADLGGRGPRPVPADVDRRRARRGLAARPTAGSTRRAGHGARGRRARAWRDDPDAHPRRRDRRRARAGHRRRASSYGRRARRRSRPRSSSTPAGCSRPRSAGSPASPSRSSRWPTSTCFTEADRRRPPGPAAAPRPGQPRATSARRSAGCAWAATSATRCRGRSTASRPTSTTGCSSRTGRGSSEIMAGADPAGPRDRRRRRHPDDQRPRGVHARTTSSSSARARSAGFFVAAGFCAHGIAGAGGIGRQVASLDRRRRAGARPVEDGHPPLRAGQYRSRARTRSPGRIENYATYYDIHYPNEERRAGRPLRVSPAYERLGGARGVVRREGRRGSGRTGSSRTRTARAWRRRPTSRRSGRAAGRASTGARRSAPRRWRRGRRPACSTRRRSRRSRSSVRARRRSSSGCAPTTSTGRSAASPTPSC